jgi:hypothetical protein
VLAAADGAAAIALVERGARRPDLLITDVDMPRLDGARARCALRERWPDLPTLFLSGAGSGTELPGPLLAKPSTTTAAPDLAHPAEGAPRMRLLLVEDDPDVSAMLPHRPALVGARRGPRDDRRRRRCGAARSSPTTRSSSTSACRTTSGLQVCRAVRGTAPPRRSSC